MDTGDDSAVLAAARVAAMWRRVRWGSAVFCLVQFATYEPAPGVTVPWPLLAWGCALAVVVALVNAGAVLVERRRPRRAATGLLARRDRLLLAADTAVVVTVVLLLAFEPTSAVWVLLVVPVLEAGLLGGLRWALAAWAVAVLTVGAREAVAVLVHHQPAPSLSLLLSTTGFRSGVLLLVAAVVGTHSTVAREHLRELRDVRLRLAHEAGHDALTGLATRRTFLETAKRVLRHQRHREGVVVLLFVDCDEFKAVNDRHGHAAGDAVLQQVARRLEAFAGPDNQVARLGGDEFAVLLQREDTADPDALAAAASYVLARPYAVPGLLDPLPMSCSVGAAAHRPEQPLADLLQHADEAMYADKSRDRQPVGAQDG